LPNREIAWVISVLMSCVWIKQSGEGECKKPPSLCRGETGCPSEIGFRIPLNRHPTFRELPYITWQDDLEPQVINGALPQPIEHSYRTLGGKQFYPINARPFD
jgi:hypothetical protein